MNASFHARAKELFLAALERASARREAFLAEACGADAALRSEVASLLAFHLESAAGGQGPPAAGDERFAPGDLFAGRYRMVTRLGRGGMGDVWQADDLVLSTPVALKLIRSAHEAGREVVLNEVRLARQITHPAVCRVFDVGEVDDDVFLSMELVRGEDLAALIERVGPLPPEKVIDIGCQLCDGLGAAHARGVLHRDLKPANILIDEHGLVRITDFGIAILGGAGGLSLPAGTPGYMAPEQAMGAPLDTRCDAWSFGAVLFEMLSGVPAFSAGTASETIAAVALNEVDWRRLPAGTPRPLRELLECCLMPDPARRLADLRQAKSVLESLMAPASGPGRVATRSPEERSLLVLPFTNISPDPRNEYFSDGLTEEIITDLSKIDALRVISRSTAMRFKAPGDVRAIARELNVRYVLEGSVRKAGVNLRITAQLVDTRNDTPIWSEKYRGTLDEMFEIQERVSRAIADALRIRLTAEDDLRLARHPPASGFVYDTYLRARRDILNFDEESLERARAQLEHALSITGENVLIYRGLGMVHWQYVNGGFTGDHAHLDRAEAYARKILELDPTGPHGPTLLGLLAVQRGDICEWIRQGDGALAASPRDPDCLFWLGSAWTWAGHPEMARPIFERLETIDPLFDYLHFGLAFVQQCEGHFGAALEHAQRARALQPDMVTWPMAMIQILIQMGRSAEAAELAAGALPAAGKHPLADMTRMLVRANTGDRAGALDLATEELKARLWTDLQYTHFMAQAYALLGEKDEALKWLEQSTRRGFIHYPYLSQRDPLLASLRGDPRFAALMEKVRVEWEWIRCLGIVRQPPVGAW